MVAKELDIPYINFAKKPFKKGFKQGAKLLNLKPNQTFLANKYKMQVEYFSKKHLRKILQELIDLDYNYKQGNIDINIGLEAILCTYCG